MSGSQAVVVALASSAPATVGRADGVGLVAVAASSVVAVILAVATAFALIALPLRRRLKDVERRLDKTHRALTRLEGQLAAAPDPVGPIPAEPARPRRAAPTPPRDRTALAPGRAPVPPPATTPSPSTGSRSGVDGRISRYRDLIASRAKPRQLQDLIDEDARPRTLIYDRDGRGLSLMPFDPNDPGQLLVAIAGAAEGTLLVLPTYNYLENFRLAFSAPVQNPEVVRHLFELDRDGGGALRLIEPAEVHFDETGSVTKLSSGRLGGYTAGA